MDERYAAPKYYADRKYEPKDVIAALDLNFFVGNVVKYMARAGKKDGNSAYDDISKAIVYAKFESDRLDKMDYKYVMDSKRHSVFFDDWVRNVKEDWGFTSNIGASCFEDVCDYAASVTVAEAASYLDCLRKDLLAWQKQVEKSDKKDITPAYKYGPYVEGWNAAMNDVINYLETMHGPDLYVRSQEITGHCNASILSNPSANKTSPIMKE